MRENMTGQADMIEIDLMKLMRAYLRKWWLILGCGLAGACIALVITMNFITPMYRADVSMYVNNARDNQSVDYVTSGDLDTSQKLVNTYINIAQSDRVLGLVSEKLGGAYSVKELREMLTASQVNKTEIFELSISSPDPEEAARVANVMAEVAPEEISNLVEGSSARIIDYAKVPEQRYTPSYTQNTVLGGLFGCVLAAVYLTAMFLLDVRIKEDEDLKALLDVPILGQIPNLETVGDVRRKGYGYAPQSIAAVKGGLFRKKDKLQAERMGVLEERRCILTPHSHFFMREAYKTLRTNVTFSLDGAGENRVIAVTSSLQREGKSTTAVNLALSFAEADKKVLLIDCDLRRPRLGQLLGLSASAGLSNLILDSSLLGQSVFKPYNSIDVLLSGDVPSNPSELLGSERMKKLLDQLRENYDCIILDTPPITMVTDAVVLAPRADGVLLAVRANQSERGAVIHAVNQLEYAQAKLLGFVLNGVDLENTCYGRYRDKKYKKCGYYDGYCQDYGYEGPTGQKAQMGRVKR